MSAVQSTTSSALTSLAGDEGDIYYVTDTQKLVVFHSNGVGNYRTFDSDGSVNESIQLTFHDGGSTLDIEDEGGFNQLTLSGSDLSGYYKRFNTYTDAQDAWQEQLPSGYDILGYNTTGSNMTPYLYQEGGANNYNSSTQTSPVLFVYTGATQGGSTATSSVPHSGGGNRDIVPVMYMINDQMTTQASAWGLTVLFAYMGTTYESYYADYNLNGSNEYGILNWGSGNFAVGNNETTLTGTSFIGESVGGYYAPAWTVDQAYVT